MALLLDYVEKEIYRSVILLTFNTVYETLAEYHGSKILGHQLVLTRRREELPPDVVERLLSVYHGKNDVDDAILERLAAAMLGNRAIKNHPLVPDAVERQLTVNCLKLMFRILNLLATSVRMTVCGHEIYLAVDTVADWNSSSEIEEEKLRDAINAQMVRSASSRLTEIDLEVLQRWARESAGIAAGGESSASLADEFTEQLYGCMYGLVLGIIDDLLNNTEIALLNDRIRFDIVPAADAAEDKRAATAAATPTTGGGHSEKGENKSTTKSAQNSLAWFVCGVGVGVAATMMTSSKHDS